MKHLLQPAGGAHPNQADANNHHKLKNEEKIFSQADKSLKGGNEVPMENVSMATKMERFGFGWYILEILKYP